MERIPILSMISPILISFACDKAEVENRHIMKTCLKLQKNYPTGSEAHQELQNLANNHVKLSVKFTAANFFELNRSTVFSLFGHTATYVVVMYQMMADYHMIKTFEKFSHRGDFGMLSMNVTQSV